MRNKNKTLHVFAAENALVREIDEKGMPLRSFRHIGRDAAGEIDPNGQIVPYHAHYVKLLKEGSLLAVTIETAELAGCKLTY